MATKKDPTKPKRKQSAAQLANLRPAWKKGCESPNPYGSKTHKENRALKLHKKLGIAKRSGNLTPLEIETIELAMLSMPLADLQLVAKADDVSAYEKTLAMAIIIDMKNGRTVTIDRLRDRQYGKPTQQLDITSNGETIAQPAEQPMSPEEAKAFLESLEKVF